MEFNVLRRLTTSPLVKPNIVGTRFGVHTAQTLLTTFSHLSCGGDGNGLSVGGQLGGGSMFVQV